jgi:hypothetical protein
MFFHSLDVQSSDVHSSSAGLEALVGMVGTRKEVAGAVLESSLVVHASQLLSSPADPPSSSSSSSSSSVPTAGFSGARKQSLLRLLTALVRSGMVLPDVDGVLTVAGALELDEDASISDCATLLVKAIRLHQKSERAGLTSLAEALDGKERKLVEERKRAEKALQDQDALMREKDQLVTQREAELASERQRAQKAIEENEAFRKELESLRTQQTAPPPSRLFSPLFFSLSHGFTVVNVTTPNFRLVNADRLTASNRTVTSTNGVAMFFIDQIVTQV